MTSIAHESSDLERVLDGFERSLCFSSYSNISTTVVSWVDGVQTSVPVEQIEALWDLAAENWVKVTGSSFGIEDQLNGRVLSDMVGYMAYCELESDAAHISEITLSVLRGDEAH